MAENWPCVAAQFGDQACFPLRRRWHKGCIYFSVCCYLMLVLKGEGLAMKRVFLCTGMLFLVAMMMGADFKETAIQREMVKLLDMNLGLVLVPKGETKAGEECSFRVTEQVVKNMQALKESSTPIQIASKSELATEKGEVLQAMGFIPRNEAVSAEDPFLFDVTDVTLKNMRGMTIIILADGTVKQRLTE